MTQVTTVLKNKSVIKQLQHGSVHDDNTDLDWIKAHRARVNETMLSRRPSSHAAEYRVTMAQ